MLRLGSGAASSAPPVSGLLCAVDFVTPLRKGEFGSVWSGVDLFGMQLRIIPVDGGRHCFGRRGQAVRVGFVAEDGFLALDSLHCVGVGMLWNPNWSCHKCLAGRLR